MTTRTGAIIGTNSRSANRLRTLWRYRELVWMLAWRDIRVRYKHTLLGAAWAVLPPLAMMFIFSFVFGAVADINRQKLTGHPTLPYTLFAFSGLVPWMFLSNGLTSATSSLVANRQLVTKIYFPREVFPFSAILSAMVDFLIASCLLVLMAAYYHARHDGWAYSFHPSVVMLPVVIGVQIIFMTGAALVLSMLNLFYRDVSYLFRFGVQLWMFVTCVVYNLEAESGWKRAVIELNPMTPIIRAYRDCLLLGQWPINAAFLNAATWSLILLLVGWGWFRRREFEFAENI